MSSFRFWGKNCDSGRPTGGTDVAIVPKCPHFGGLLDAASGKVFATTRHSQWLKTSIFCPSCSSVRLSSFLGKKTKNDSGRTTAGTDVAMVSKCPHCGALFDNSSRKVFALTRHCVRENESLFWLIFWFRPDWVPGRCKYFSTGGVVIRWLSSSFWWV